MSTTHLYTLSLHDALPIYTAATAVVEICLLRRRPTRRGGSGARRDRRRGLVALRRGARCCRRGRRRRRCRARRRGGRRGRAALLDLVPLLDPLLLAVANQPAQQLRLVDADEDVV